MGSSIHILTSTKDLARNLCEAVHHAVQQDTDMVIVTKDNRLLPCHSSLLALFSPVVARLLSEIPCCAAPTIFLPDFYALHVRKLLHILRYGQAIPGEYVNSDIKKIITIAKVLQISIDDLSVGPYLDNPLGLTLEVKQESKILNVKQERHSVDVVEVLNVKKETDSFNVKQEEKLAKQELMEQNEYIEEDVPEKTEKQEYAVSVDDDQLLDDISDFQTVVEEEVQESNALDKEDYNTVSIDNIQLNEDEETGSLKHKANSNKRTSLRLLRQKEFIETPRNQNNKRRKTPCRQLSPQTYAHARMKLQSSLDSTDNSTTIIPFNQY